MKSCLLVCAVCLVAAASAAHAAPLRGLGLIALESSAAQRDVGHTPGGSALLISPDDDGGGSIGARAARGGESSASRHEADAGMTPDALPHAIPPIDPALPAATPKHPSYRWQALVPGALK